MSMHQHCLQHRHLGSNWGSLHPNCSESPVLIVDLLEDFESRSFGSRSSIQDFYSDSVAQLMRSITKFRSVIIELMDGLTMSWIREDSRFVRFLEKRASNFALSSLRRRTSRRSLSWGRSISGPAADWAAQNSPNISRYCCGSWTNPVKCWCSPASSGFCGCVTSSACRAWRLSSARKSYTCSSRLHTSDLTSDTKISRWSSRAWFASCEIEITDPSVFDKSCICFMCELSNLHLRKIIGALHYVWTWKRQDFAAQPLKFDEWQQEIILVDGAQHVEPFHADHSELFVHVLCNTLDSLRSKNCRYTLRYVQGYWNCQEFTLVWLGIGWRLGTFRTRWPSACENVTNAVLFNGVFAHAGCCNAVSDMWDFVSSSSSVKSTTGTYLPLISISLLGSWHVFWMVYRHTVRQSGDNTKKNVRDWDAHGSDKNGCCNCRTQVKQISNDDLMERFYNPTLNHKSADSVRSASTVCIRTTTLKDCVSLCTLWNHTEKHYRKIPQHTTPIPL